MESRRDFLKGTAWMGVAAMASGCRTAWAVEDAASGGTPMANFRCDPIRQIRVGMIGVGGDFAGNRPLISPRAYREFIVPEVRRVADAVHADGLR